MILTLLLILALIFINGFYAASEMALVSISPQDMHNIKRNMPSKASTLQSVISDSTAYLSTIQVAITFAGFLSSAYAGSTFADYFVTLFQSINVSIPKNIMVIIITFILSFFTLVFGELVPKRIALSSSTSFAIFCAPIIKITMNVFRPFVWLLTKSTNLVMAILPIKNSTEQDDISEHSIKEMIVYGHIKGLYQAEETNMLKRIFTFDDLTTNMIMTPIDEVIGITMNQSTHEVDSIIRQSQYSRLPVFNEDKTSIVGILLIKDYLLSEEKDIKEHMREPYVVPPKKTINIVLQDMKHKKEHLAVVQDKDTLLGIITLEDIIEEITGDIYDEHDTSIEEDLHEQSYIIPEKMTVQELNKRFNREVLPQEQASKTVLTYLEESLQDANKTMYEVLPFQYGYLQLMAIKNNKIKQLKLYLYEQTKTSS
jgi:putative hemolysin